MLYMTCINYVLRMKNKMRKYQNNCYSLLLLVQKDYYRLQNKKYTYNTRYNIFLMLLLFFFR